MNKLKEFFREPSFLKLTILAIIVGVIGGFASIVFISIVNFFTFIFFQAPSDTIFLERVAEMPWYLKILIPGIGGLIVGLIINRANLPEIKGHGVSEVIEAIENKGGKIKSKVAPFTTLTSALTISSGGSAGKEGPIVQIGSSAGSSIAQYFRLDSEKTKLLLASGAAAGIGGIFNAPLAGVIFAWEILLKKMKFFHFFIILAASIMGTMFTNTLLGSREAFFSFSSLSISSNYELIFLGILGVIALLLAIVYIRILYFSEDFFEKIKIPPMLKPFIGGLLLGLLAIFFLPVYGPANYAYIEEIMGGLISIEFLVVIIFAKIIATSLTLGSGATGGIFAPSLFIGSALGMAYGSIIQKIFPAMSISPGLYAAAAMGAVFAASAHAPFTAAIIVLEMSQNISLGIPVAIACLTAGFIAKNTQETNIYTEKIRRNKEKNLKKSDECIS